jgi:hypothetical protein
MCAWYFVWLLHNIWQYTGYLCYSKYIYARMYTDNKEIPFKIYYCNPFFTLFTLLLNSYKEAASTDRSEHNSNERKLYLLSSCQFKRVFVIQTYICSANWFVYTICIHSCNQYCWCFYYVPVHVLCWEQCLLMQDLITAERMLIKA